MHGANAAGPVTPIGQPGNLHHPRNRTRTICREDPTSSRQVARNASRDTRHTGAAGCRAPHLMRDITAVIHRIDQTRTGAPPHGDTFGRKRAEIAQHKMHRAAQTAEPLDASDAGQLTRRPIA